MTMTSKLKLKPCPFCGGEAQLYVAPPNENEHILFEHYGVACTSCHTMIGTTIHGLTDFFDTPQEAANAWNARIKAPI